MKYLDPDAEDAPATPAATPASTVSSTAYVPDFKLETTSKASNMDWANEPAPAPAKKDVVSKFDDLFGGE